MLRVSELLFAVVLVLIAGAIGAGAAMLLGLPRTEAAVVALAALTLLVLYNLAVARARDRREAARQIVDLSRGIADLARQIGHLEQRLATVASSSETAIQRLSAVHQPLAAEVAELGTLVRGHAGPAAHTPAAIAAVSPLTARLAAAQTVAGETPESIAAVGGQAGESSSAESADALVALVRQAVNAAALDTYLQPIVTLPQRKVSAYEATARLRAAGGPSPSPQDVLAAAESAGLAGEIDVLMAFRCVRVARRLNPGEENIAVFCTLSRQTLGERETFARIADLMEANRALAHLLVFQFALAPWRALRASEQEALSTLASFGFRFCLDHITDLRFDARELADHGCAFVKAPASLLLGDLESGAPPPTRLASELARVGIKLIAEKVEAEPTVMDLLDLDVGYAQGGLFSPPRPVRSDVMGGTDAAVLPTPASQVTH
jgi:cyclic-di-GMP phosphodiesterase TipF (flagellum assembly factor)